MALFVTLLVVLSLAICVFAIRNHSAKLRCRRKSRKGHLNPFHAVEAHLHPGFCRAAKRLRGKRFLAAEAPLFPLSGCTCSNCRCDYTHFDDRRQDSRRLDIGLMHDLYGKNGEPERRLRRGRRQTD